MRKGRILTLRCTLGELLVGIGLLAIPFAFILPRLGKPETDEVDALFAVYARRIIVVILLGSQMLFWFNVVPVFRYIRMRGIKKAIRNWFGVAPLLRYIRIQRIKRAKGKGDRREEGQ